MTKYKRTKYECDKMKKDKTQIWHFTKRQNTNMTLHKKTQNKYDFTTNMVLLSFFHVVWVCGGWWGDF